MPYPVEPGEMIAKPEPPARDSRCHHAAQAPRRSTIDEPNENGKGDERDRPDIARRQRQHGGRAGKAGDQVALPSPSEHDRVREASERHGWRAAFAGAASDENLGSLAAPAGKSDAGVLGFAAAAASLG